MEVGGGNLFCLHFQMQNKVKEVKSLAPNYVIDGRAGLNFRSPHLPRLSIFPGAVVTNVSIEAGPSGRIAFPFSAERWWLDHAEQPGCEGERIGRQGWGAKPKCTLLLLCTPWHGLLCPPATAGEEGLCLTVPYPSLAHE